MVRVYRHQGKLLRRPGGIAAHEDCCCDDRGNCCELGPAKMVHFGTGGGAFCDEFPITWTKFSETADETVWYSEQYDTCFNPPSFRIWFKCHHDETGSSCGANYEVRVTTEPHLSEPPFTFDSGWWGPDPCPPCQCVENLIPTAWFDTRNLGLTHFNCCSNSAPDATRSFIAVGRDVDLVRPLACDYYPYQNNPPDNNEPIPVRIRMPGDPTLGTSAVNVDTTATIFSSNETANAYITPIFDASALCNELCPDAPDKTFDLRIEFTIIRDCGCAEMYPDLTVTKLQGTSCDLINSGMSGGLCECRCAASGHFEWPPEHRVHWGGWDIQGCGEIIPVVAPLEVYVFDLTPDDTACGDATLVGGLGGDTIVGTSPDEDEAIRRIVGDKDLKEWLEDLGRS